MSAAPFPTAWPGSITARERFARQMHHLPVDRCFNREFGYWQENFEVWPMFVANGVKGNAAADRFLKFDPSPTVYGQVWIHPPFAEEVHSETESTRIIINPEGLLAEVPKHGGGSSIPHFLRSSVETPDDWHRVKEERFRVDDPGRTVDVAALKALHGGGDRDYPLGVDVGSMIGKVRDLLTLEGLAYACADYPEMVEDMVETCCRLVERFLDQALGHFPFEFAAGWEDICCNAGPLVPIDFFREVVVPRYVRISRKLRAHGIDIYIVDCDGDVRRLIPHFLEGGVNTMFPWEVNGSGHPGEALDRWGPELRIMGGVDKMALGRGPAATRAWLESIAPWVERGGFIPFCDHRCPPNVRQEDYLYYLELKRQMFGMASHGNHAT